MQFTVCRGVVFSLAILDEVYVNKKLGGGPSCKLQIANWLRHFLQPLIFLFLFLSRKKESQG
jgi:hypothetical protein